MQKFLQALEHHMVQYLTIGFFGVFAAILLFWVGGSLAEVTGNEKSVAGVSFKAGGVFAGFLLVFFASTPIIKGLRRLEERGKTLEEQEKRLQAGREDLERKARPHLKLHFTSSPKSRATWTTVVVTRCIMTRPERRRVLMPHRTGRRGS